MLRFEQPETPLMKRTLVALLSVAGLAACQDAGARSAAMLAPGDRFVVTAIDGIPAPEGVTLEVGSEGRISGRAPCNRFSAQLTHGGGAMTASGLVITRMACLDPGRALAEARFTAALGAVTGARRGPGGPELVDPRGTARIALAPAGGT